MMLTFKAKGGTEFFYDSALKTVDHGTATSGDPQTIRGDRGDSRLGSDRICVACGSVFARRSEGDVNYGYVLTGVIVTLGLSLGLGKVEEKTSFGLRELILILGMLASQWAQWAHSG